VLGAVGGVYDVELADRRQVPARLRGRLKLEQRTGDRIVAGDRVTVTAQPDGDGWTIEAVDPRRTQLARRAPGRGSRRAKVLVANVDQVVAVVAATRPEPRLRTLDRLLVLAESNELTALIVVNKLDLVTRPEVEARFHPYLAAGYEILLTSVAERVGLAELSARLCGRDSVLTGPSGVGKSSLLNELEPGLGLRVAEVSSAVGKGRHTTVSARLVPLHCGGHVADTPGLREVGLWGVDHDALAHHFVEFRALAPDCRFGWSCTHVHEPECAVQDAVAAGRLDDGRYQSYLAMRADEPPPAW
jgi:ribosome biogenesis GTPase / thiamine phosphate phosphatase